MRGSQRQLWHSEGIPKQLRKKALRWKECSCSSLLTLFMLPPTWKLRSLLLPFPTAITNTFGFSSSAGHQTKLKLIKSSPPIAQLETGFWNPHLKTGDEAILTTVTYPIRNKGKSIPCCRINALDWKKDNWHNEDCFNGRINALRRAGVCHHKVLGSMRTPPPIKLRWNNL